MIYINTPEHKPLKLIDGRELKEASDFKYPGSWVNSTEGDIKIRKAKAWKALNDTKKIWNSAMSREVKISFFLATVESVLLYGCETWSLTHSLEKSLNGCYTHMLRSALGTPGRKNCPTLSSTATSRGWCYDPKISKLSTNTNHSKSLNFLRCNKEINKVTLI